MGEDEKIMRVYLTDVQKKLLFELAHGAYSRQQLVELTGIPRTTIYDNLVKLEKLNVVERFKVYDAGIRRPYIYWRFRKTS